ncbi:hypothetical protein EVAR_90996_1 [Eumeta japonica]|uniref:Uncharacterized protein n=1 Tax=Eumeta variegata TaxID=151549 RepID=A0A4C1Z4F0_EUMVA|nr:hypothetical protein EVAR_90996_1 [Eumeta japonica]
MIEHEPFVDTVTLAGVTTPAKKYDAGSSLYTSLHSLWLGVHLHTQHTQMRTRNTRTHIAFTERCIVTVRIGGRRTTQKFLLEVFRLI